jgi:hypothetical protein
LCYFSLHDKSANAGTTLFGGFDVDYSKTPSIFYLMDNGSLSFKWTDGKDWFGCHLPEPVTGNLTDPKLCGHWSPVAFKKLKL